MRRSGWFERRLLLALVLFSLVPSLLLVGVGTALLREAVSLQTAPAGWNRLAESGQALLERAEAAGDPDLGEAAARHREELATSVQQAQRWGYLNRRVLELLPWGALLFLTLLGLLAARAARGMARELARPISELVGWSAMVARGAALPPPVEGDAADAGEFGILRASLREMADELKASRVRALEAARVRASVALARGVAHELKNSLTPLRLAVRTLRNQQSRNGDESEPLEVIESESWRLEELARAFSQFGRPPEGPSSAVDLRELLEYLTRTHLPPRVERVLDFAEEMPPVNGYLDSLSRAFGNVLLNAAEAMGPEGGSIRVTARPGREGEVEVRIADSGPGLPTEALSRLWDPDFTTKARGTGLGLALARQTVHAHGGRIEAWNHAEGGAEFRIVLPAGRPVPGPEIVAAVAG